MGRPTAVLSGLEDLDVRLSDQVQHGMVNFVAQPAQTCRTISQRLVDAKAAGLAGRLYALPTRLFTLPDPVRPLPSIHELGQLYRLVSAKMDLELTSLGSRSSFRKKQLNPYDGQIRKLFARFQFRTRSCRFGSTNQIRGLHSMAVFFKVWARSFPTKVLDGVKHRYIQSQSGKGAKQQGVVP